MLMQFICFNYKGTIESEYYLLFNLKVQSMDDCHTDLKQFHVF